MARPPDGQGHLKIGGHTRIASSPVCQVLCISEPGHSTLLARGQFDAERRERSEKLIGSQHAEKRDSAPLGGSHAPIGDGGG